MARPAHSSGTPHARGSPWRLLRMTALLLLLLVTALSTWLTKMRTASWERPLWVAIYPINADGTAVSSRYVARLDKSAFAAIDAFFAREGSRYALPLAHPVEAHLYAPILELPPTLPQSPGVFATMLWTLKLRYWAWRVTRGRDEATPDAQLFVLYHDPDITDSVPHSLGLEKGMVGVVYAFAADRATAPNDIVITHELMHTHGATDKYNPDTDEPSYPDGYAEPGRKPLTPQSRVEIMAGRMMLSPTTWDMPDSLDAAVIGPKSAREINWNHQ